MTVETDAELAPQLNLFNSIHCLCSDFVVLGVCFQAFFPILFLLSLNFTLGCLCILLNNFMSPFLNFFFSLLGTFFTGEGFHYSGGSSVFYTDMYVVRQSHAE